MTQLASTHTENDDAPRRRRLAICFLIGIAALITVMALPKPGVIDTPNGPLELSDAGKAALAVLVFAVIMWATEAIPFAVTGLLAIVLLVMMRVASLKALVEWGFGNTIVLFFLGVLIFSAAIAETDLLKRLTTFVLYRLGHRPEILILAFLIVGAMLSAWITDMAVAAMLMPIGVGILRDAGAKPLKSNFGRALMIACAWGPLMGGVATPAGCGPNPLTIGFLKDLAGIDFSFTDWMLLGFPATLMMIPIGWFILIKMFPLEPVNLRVSEDDYRVRMKAFGSLKWREVATLLIFGLMVTLWLFPKQINGLLGGRADYLDIRFVAIACACLLFLPGIRIISWKRTESSISWGGIILIVAGLSLGKAIHATGAAEWLAYVAFHRLGSLHPVLVVFAVVLGVSLMKVAFSSNTVTGAIMVPLMIALATTLGLDPRMVAIPAGITASLAFILVTSTPTNVIPYSSGYFSIMDMVKAGLFMTVASSACVTASICIMGPLFGIVNL